MELGFLVIQEPCFFLAAWWNQGGWRWDIVSISQKGSCSTSGVGTLGYPHAKGWSQTLNTSHHTQK